MEQNKTPKNCPNLENDLGDIQFPTEIKEKSNIQIYGSRSLEEIIENINNVSGVEITVSENSALLEPPFGDKYLGFVFSQGEKKEKVMESLTLAMNLANPIIE